MTTRTRLLFAAAAALVLLAACSDETPTEPPDGSSDLVSGDLTAAGPGFALKVEAAGTPDRPRTGPFILHGGNLRWDDGMGALAVDLRLENAGRGTHPEPVGLTFTRLIPDSVRVLDADNGLEGPGAAIAFGFANDDAMWTPGEISLPRTVHFAAREGHAVAFGARLDVGDGPLAGSISGLVWNDVDKDGVRDDGEPPLAGVAVLLLRPDCDGNAAARNGDEDRDGDDDCDDPDHERDHLLWTRTGPDGRYAFTGLAAGLHTVRAAPMPPAGFTTDPELHVLLVAVDGGVSSFEHADFGLAVPLGGLLEVRAEADAAVRTDLPERRNDNTGCEPVIAVGRGRDGAPDRIRGLLRFALPDTAPLDVVSARLVLQVDRFRDGTGQVYDLDVNAVVDSDSLTPWVEGNGSEFPDGSDGCVWVDDAYGVAWVGAGDGGDANNTTQPDFAPEAAASAIVAQDGMGPSGLVSFDVTRLVRAWLDGSLPNHGVFVRDTSAPGDFRSLWFVSREGERAGWGRGPRLMIQYGEMPPD